jgi:hypothetical protein
MSRHGSEHGTIPYVLVVLVVVAVVIVGAVVAVAIGYGGEMARFTADARPLAADIETAADVALLRPPGSMWGYNKRATDEALNAVAQSVTERDVEIAALRQRLADLQDPWQWRPARDPAAARADAPGRSGSPGEPSPSDPPGAGSWSAWQPSDPAGQADQPGDATGQEDQPRDVAGQGDQPRDTVGQGDQPGEPGRPAEDSQREESE